MTEHPGIVLVVFVAPVPTDEPRFITANVDQAERLAAAGLMRRADVPPPTDAHDSVYAALGSDREAVLAALREAEDVAVCDFCSRRPVTRSFPARSFKTPIPNNRSLDAWAACAECAALVARGDQPSLTLRALDAVMAEGIPAEARRAVHETLTDLHRAFFANQLDPKEGEPVMPNKDAEVAP